MDYSSYVLNRFISVNIELITVTIYSLGLIHDVISSKRMNSCVNRLKYEKFSTKCTMMFDSNRFIWEQVKIILYFELYVHNRFYIHPKFNLIQRNRPMKNTTQLNYNFDKRHRSITIWAVSIGSTLTNRLLAIIRSDSYHRA